MCEECIRIKFVETRDGAEAAITFAKQVRLVYRRSVLQTGKNGRVFHYGSTREFKLKFIVGYLVAKRFINSNAML